MSKVHNGVLIPDEMRDASSATLDEYAASVKQGNRAFIDAYFALEDEAARLGISLDS
jgi:hypothetical protein